MKRGGDERMRVHLSQIHIMMRRVLVCSHQKNVCSSSSSSSSNSNSSVFRRVLATAVTILRGSNSGGVMSNTNHNLSCLLQTGGDVGDSGGGRSSSSSSSSSSLFVSTSTAAAWCGAFVPSRNAAVVAIRNSKQQEPPFTIPKTFRNSCWHLRDDDSNRNKNHHHHHGPAMQSLTFGGRAGEIRCFTAAATAAATAADSTALFSTARRNAGSSRRSSSSQEQPLPSLSSFSSLDESSDGGDGDMLQNDDGDVDDVDHDPAAPTSRSNNSNSINEFASSYHVPVMWKECIDALLDCRRGQERRKGQEHQEQQQPEYERRQRRPPLYFVDGTVGGGGHSQALLQALQPGDVVLGCDVDPDALAAASRRLKMYMIQQSSSSSSSSSLDVVVDDENNHCNQLLLPLFIPVQCNFCDLHKILPRVLHPVTQQPLFPRNNSNSSNNNIDKDGDDTLTTDSTANIGTTTTGTTTTRLLDGILLDLGVSSHQIDEATRGFAFMQDGPLDMRMTAGGSNSSNSGRTSSHTIPQQQPQSTGLSAADVCNEWDEQELTRIFKVYGDEPRARKIAASIVASRPLSKTFDLVAAVAAVTPAFSKKSKRLGRTATCARVFQSLRIVVNQEDVVLQRVLQETCPTLLRPGGRLVVLSYHSMEDRAAKRIMRDGSTTATSPTTRSAASSQRDVYGNYNGPPKPFRPVQKPQKASAAEIELNSRARSATLRVAERLES
jgi:16S rRNA (cytosine1402-N4)-methyltransferase